MNPYMLTLTFLMLMSVLTSSEIVRFSQSTLGNQLHQDYQESLAVSEKVRALADFEEFRNTKNGEVKDEEGEKEKKEKPKPKSRIRRSTPLQFSFVRPPNNSRLNLHFLYEKPQDLYPVSTYEATARLMRKLYKGTLFYTPGVEYRILDALLEKAEIAKTFHFPDEFATLEFNDEEIQKTLYHMLKGHEGRPSLLNFVTFDQGGTRETKKVNLMFASPIVIEALLDNPVMTERLFHAREALWDKILEQEAHRLELTNAQCKGRRDFKKELEETYKQILLEAGLDYDIYKWVFDLSLGKLGNILFVEDMKTGFIRREKYVKRGSS